MKFKRVVLVPGALLLLAGGSVLAKEYYVAVNNALYLEEPDIFTEGWREKLKVDAIVEYDGELDFANGKAHRENTFIKVRVPGSAHSEGFMRTSSLWDKRSSASAMSAEERASSGREGASAAARGFTKEIEDKAASDDKAFAENIAKVDRLEKFVNREIRGEPGGSYEKSDPKALMGKVSAFRKEGGLK